MSLWYVDRSRFEAGTQDCTWKRYLGYHFGPSGYGIARQAQSIPLATGTGSHAGMEIMGRWALEHQEATEIPLEIIRGAAKDARTAYTESTRKSGIVDVADPERVDYLIGEQGALIAGLTWCAGLAFFPWLLTDYEIVAVETEETLVLDCTCGLGDRIGTDSDHAARDCNGICFMSRPDLITRSRLRPDSHQYWEFKTTSRTSQAWQDSWETKIQFHAGIVACEARLGIRIDETYVVGLYKGDRRKNKEGVAMQGSVCCYGYKLPAVPPMQSEKWEALYEDKTRTPQRLSPKWEKTPIWLTDFGHMVDVEITPAGGLRAAADSEPIEPIEYWIRWLSPELRSQQIAIVGPFNRQDTLIQGFLRDLVPHERQWQTAIWNIYQALDAAGWDWANEDVQREIGENIQRSWNCQKFGAEHKCPMYGLCFRQEGWEDPLAHGFVLRRPHHEPELQAALASGVIPPEVAVESEEE